MAITLSVSNGKLVSDVDFYSPSGGIVELTLSAGAFINQYSPVEHDVTVYQWQYDSEKVELDYGSVTMSGNGGSFELKFGCEFFVLGLRVGEHETIQTVPIHIGGGSGLPAPTAADLGKVVTVVESSSEPSIGDVIVPEQTVTVLAGNTGAELENVDESLFVVGAHVIMEVNGAQYEGTVIMEDETHPGVHVTIDDEEYAILLYGASWVFSCPAVDADTEFTVALYEAVPAEVEYGLAAGSSGGSGGVVFITESDTYLSMKCSEIMSAISNNILPAYIYEDHGEIVINPLTRYATDGLSFSFDNSTFVADSIDDYPSND